MSIFNEFFKKEKPVFTGLKFGFGSGGGGAAGPPGFYEGSATGGAISGGIADPTGNFRYFVFPEPGNMTLSSDVDGPLISILAVGGGGGGGSGHAGGGGAGCVIHLDFGGSPVPGATHAVAVGGGGAGGNSPNKGTAGNSTTFGTNPSNYYIEAPGGGFGAGWNDPSGKGSSGGSGGGDSGTPTGVPASAPEAIAIPDTDKFNGNATSYGNNGGVGDYAGGGGGGAGTVGQNCNAPKDSAGDNPTTIPSGHPNYPNGGGGGTGPFAAGAPYQNPTIMTSAPFAATIWPPAANFAGGGPPLGPDIGAWGGHGRPFSEFPGPEIAPGIPSGSRTNWTSAVGPTGIFGAGGGGGSHTNSGNPYTPGGGGMGGIGGGGNGNKHPPTGTGTSGRTGGVNFTGSGGGGSGNQPASGGSGGTGVVIVKIKMQ